MNAATGSTCCSSAAGKGGSSLLTLLGVAGVLRLLSMLHATSWGGGALRVLWGALTIVCAALVIINPVAGVFTLTLMLAIYFVIQGIAEIVLALRMKPNAGWAGCCSTALLRWCWA